MRSPPNGCEAYLRAVQKPASGSESYAAADDRDGEALVLTALPVPPPGHGEVLIRVQVAVNPMAAQIADGDRRTPTAGVARTTGWADVAGTVEQVGAGVTRFRLGERIIGHLAISPHRATGGHDGHVAVADDAPLARAPEGLDPAAAAVLPTAGMTGLALVESLGPLKGKTVLIVGADGVVGAFATQFAADARARVIVHVGGQAGARRMLGYGAIDTIDDTAVPLREAVSNRGRIDALIDLASDAPRFAELAANVRPYGMAVSTRQAVDIAAVEAAAVTGMNFRLVPSAGLLERVVDALMAGRVVMPLISELARVPAPALGLSRHADRDLGAAHRDGARQERDARGWADARERGVAATRPSPAR